MGVIGILGRPWFALFYIIIYCHVFVGSSFSACFPSETMMMVDLAVWIDQIIIMNDQDKKPAVCHYQLITPT